MRPSSYYIESTESTNQLLQKMVREEELPEGFVVYTDFQTAGKGQPGNTWESEQGKNLLFSILLYPHHIPIYKQFVLSQITCLAVKKALEKYIDGDLSVKWSNDVYWNEKKICGVLIENSLVRDRIDRCVVGIGLNVNQTVFTGNAPNPISLKQIVGKETDRNELLAAISTHLLELYRSMDTDAIHHTYLQSLYRREGYHSYADAASGESFKAKIETVEQDGKLILIEDTNRQREYYFKEVKFIP